MKAYRRAEEEEEEEKEEKEEEEEEEDEEEEEEDKIQHRSSDCIQHPPLPWRMGPHPPPGARGLHSSTFQLNLSRFVWDRGCA